MTLDDGLIEQFARACQSVAVVITEAGGAPTDLVSMTIFTTDVSGYRESLGPIGEAYRQVFGKHFPPMALIGVAELFDPKAKVELVCTAVI
jgi:enamine deaminase RidA (YjgF/YER057c/UK114 family)